MTKERLPLGDAAADGDLETVKRLLEAGVNVEAVNYLGETALYRAVEGGDLACVEALLAAGADPTHVARDHNLLLVVLTEGTVEIADAIVAAITDDAVYARLLREATGGEPLDPEQYDPDVIDVLVERAGGDEDVLVVPAPVPEEHFVALGTAAAVAEPGWAERVREVITPLPDGLDAIRALCRHTLVTADAVAHPAWPELVEAVLDRSHSYGDITEACYGERLDVDAMDDDEGCALDLYADHHLHTFGLVLDLLADERALASPAWASLVSAVCREKRARIGAMSFGDDEIARLLAAPHVQRHAGYAAIAEAARAAFPYARR